MFGGLLRRSGDEPVEERAINLSQYASAWAEGGAYSPVSVSTASALTNAACSACVEQLASSVSAMPLDAVRKNGEMREPVTPTPSLIRQPSGLVARDVWLHQLQVSRLTDGNAFGEIVTYGPGGFPTSIDLYDPETVTDRRVEDGVPVVRIGNEVRALYPYGDVWHMPGPLVRPGKPFADSPIERAKATIGAAIAARDFGSRFFGEGGHPTALVTAEQQLTAEQAEGIKGAVRRALKPGSREPLVMGAGLSWEQIQVSPDDSQFLELMEFTIQEACRFWRVPPSMVYAAISGQNVTYANASQADLAYLKHSLESHLVRIETGLTDLLPRPQFVRFNRNAFLRSDPVTRSEVHDRRLKNRTITVNEVRSDEDERPFDGAEFDEPGIPGGAVPPPTQDLTP